VKDKREFSIAVFMKGGHIDVDRAALSAELADWPDGPSTLTITEGRTKRPKTYQQIKYWWAKPVKLIADHCGYTDAQMHYALLGEWSGWVDGPNGHPIPAKPSMSEYSVDDMNKIIDWVLIWAPSELHVNLPPPDKNWRLQEAS